MRRRVTAADTLEMSVDERLELVGDIWEGIAASPEALQLQDDERDEIRRRLEAYRADPNAGDPWHEVRGRIQRRHRQS